jgi:nitroimidazol reductase NimA-like FMN-containing flavoprotein (pyridoxamine 5'-phosphate oxidase superfamily)
MHESHDAPTPTGRVRLRRKADRGHHDESTIKAILDEGFICHVGFPGDDGPVVVPTAYARVGDLLYLHGAVGNATLRALSAGVPACVTVTLVDGLVLARSAFHHSINYRSVVVFGTASEVTDAQDKRAALTAIVEHLVAGRSADARPPTDEELRATRVVQMPLGEASAKVRAGGPIDDPEDQCLPVWAGQIPLRLVAAQPIADIYTPAAVPTPSYVTSYSRRPNPRDPDHRTDPTS